MKSVSALLLVMLLAAGCVGTPKPGAAAATTLPEPFPQGPAWPPDLRGPFGVAQVLPVRIPSHDGVILDGEVWLPRVPGGVPVPVVLHSTPYTGTTSSHADARNFLDAVDVRWMLQSGYAFANFNVRGTGESGGCFDLWGPDEQKDQSVLVDWLADQSWSNGRVGMYGISYMGTTPWMAAIQNPPALKTIVAAGIISDVYLTAFSPQGAANEESAAYTIALSGGLTFAPLPLVATLFSPGLNWTRHLTEYASIAPQRLCASAVQVITTPQRGAVSDRRDESFFAPRRLVDGFPNITTSVLIAHGLRDMGGHGFQEDAVWGLLDRAPKRMMVGAWGHEFPASRHLNGYRAAVNWSQVVLPWLDYWLKGLGDAPPRLGLVDYQTQDGPWRATTAWPPADAHDEVLYVSDPGLRSQPGGNPLRFRAGPDTALIDCQDILRRQPHAAIALSEPLGAETVLAGNPFAYLAVTSDQPGGVLNVDLYDVAPSPRCEDPQSPGLRWLTRGSADLRFHAGSYTGHDFPVNQPTQVRIDLMNIAETLPPGHRLALVVRGIEAIDPSQWGSAGQAYAPSITLGTDGMEQASHIVLPVQAGTLGGAAPTIAYPPRPFLPDMIHP